MFSTLDKPEFAKTWTVERRENALPDWPLRGLDMGEEGRKDKTDGLIRCERSLGTHGFFVAVLVRQDRPSEGSRSLQASAQQQTHPSQAAAKAQKKTSEKAAKRQKDLERILSHPRFGLLRMATLNRQRRERARALQAVRKLSTLAE